MAWIWMALQAVVHPPIIKIRPNLWVGLFTTVPSTLAVVPKPKLKLLGNRYMGPFQLQPAGWSQFLLQLPSAQIRFGDRHGNSLHAGKPFQLLASIRHPQGK